MLANTADLIGRRGIRVFYTRIRQWLAIVWHVVHSPHAIYEVSALVPSVIVLYCEC